MHEDSQLFNKRAQWPAFLVSFAAIWLIWVGLTVQIERNTSVLEPVSQKSAIVTDAKCDRNKGQDGIDFMADYGDGLERDYFHLPPFFACTQEFASELNGKRIEIDYVRNFYLEIIIDGKEIRNRADTVREIQDTSGIHLFTLFVAVIASLAAYMRFVRHGRRNGAVRHS